MDNTKESLINGEHVTPELSCIIVLSEMDTEPYRKEIIASKIQCRRLAKRFGLIELKSFEASLKLALLSTKSSVLVEANFRAELVQQCVVTLETVSAVVQGNYHCKYAEAQLLGDLKLVEFGVNTSDPPELILNGQFDAGIVLTEQLGLEIDPFPRKQKADFESVKNISFPDTTNKYSNNPFSILEKMK